MIHAGADQALSLFPRSIAPRNECPESMVFHWDSKRRQRQEVHKRGGPWRSAAIALGILPRWGCGLAAGEAHGGLAWLAWHLGKSRWNGRGACSAPVLGCSGIGVYFCGWAGCMHEHSHRGEPGNMDQFAGDGMCWSLITLGALGAAGWQLPAPQDKSQASKAGFKGTAAPFGTRCLDMSISNKGRKRSLKACWSSTQKIPLPLHCLIVIILVDLGGGQIGG